jgi:hypothetical protein
VAQLVSLEAPPRAVLALPAVTDAVTRFRAAIERAAPPGTWASSWWRSASWNASVGGAPDSQHLLGLAVDIGPPTAQLAQRMRLAGFVTIDEGDHLHVQAYPAGSIAPLIASWRARGWLT